MTREIVHWVSGGVLGVGAVFVVAWSVCGFIILFRFAFSDDPENQFVGRMVIFLLLMLVAGFLFALTSCAPLMRDGQRSVTAGVSTTAQAVARRAENTSAPVTLSYTIPRWQRAVSGCDVPAQRIGFYSHQPTLRAAVEKAEKAAARLKARIGGAK